MSDVIGSFETTVQTDAEKKAFEAEQKALTDFKVSIKDGFEALHHSSKFEVIRYLNELARIEKERFY